MATILIIDNDESHRILLRKALEAVDHSVSEAVNGTEGLRRIGIEKPDIVITEVYMPVIDGIEILTSVKRDRPECKVVAMAVESDEIAFDALDAARLLGADGILRKPLRSGDILSMVRQVMSPVPSRRPLLVAANM